MLCVVRTLYNHTFTEYADYEKDKPDEKYAKTKKPYDLKCPLPYTDSNSVRWFYVCIQHFIFKLSILVPFLGVIMPFYHAFCLHNL